MPDIKTMPRTTTIEAVATTTKTATTTMRMLNSTTMVNMHRETFSMDTITPPGPAEMQMKEKTMQPTKSILCHTTEIVSRISTLSLIFVFKEILTRCLFPSTDTVRFNKCLSFAIEDEDIVQDTELIYYANTGVVVSQKSYILFDIQECEPGSCVFDESDLSKIHIVALEDFIDSFIEYFPAKKEAYCEQCRNHYSYCTSQEGAFFDNAVFRNGGSFCYDGQQYAMINCKQCWQMGCLSEGYEEGIGEVNEWIESMAGCKETKTWWKNYPLYTGLTCNTEGDGVEFGVFIDDSCKTYHRQKSFRNVIADDDWQMLFQTPSIIEYMFTSSMTCKDDSGIKYMNAYQPVYGYSSNSDFANAVAKEGNTCELGEDVNDSCLTLFQDNTMGYSLADCLKQVPSWSGSNNNNQNNDQDDNYELDEEWVANSLYRYELSASDLNDMGKVCHLIANKYAYYASGGSVGALVSSYGKGTHQNVFNEEGSGSMFNYNTAKNNYYTKEQHDIVLNSWGIKADRMTLAEKLTFILLGVGSFVIVIAAVARWCKSRQSRVEFVDKNLPLID